MKINKITVSYSTTVQMRQFEPVSIYASAEVQLDPGDHLDTVFRKTYNELHQEIEAQAEKKKIERRDNYDKETEKTV